MNTFWERVGFAFRCFVSILFHASIPNDISERLVKSASTTSDAIEEQTSETFDRAVQMLALLQRDGRLVDFLTEDIAPYPDAQLGAAVRTIHETCRKVLEDYVRLEPVLDSAEDQPVTVESGFNPAVIKLIGNVAGEPPIRGVLRHKGWRAVQVNLPPLLVGAARMVVAPAEVELL